MVWIRLEMKRIMFCLVLSLMIPMLGFARHKSKSPRYPELSHVRKVYVPSEGLAWGFSDHGGMRHIRNTVREISCLRVVNHVKDADAVLAVMAYKGLLYKLTEASPNVVCSSDANGATCSGPGGDTTVMCNGSGGCVSWSDPVNVRSIKLIFIDPKTGEQLSGWQEKVFWGMKKKIARAVGCSK